MKTAKNIFNILIVISVFFIIFGFIYDVMFAGIPFQDPTQKMIEQYNFHKNISNSIVYIGGIVLLISTVSRIAVKIFFRK